MLTMKSGNSDIISHFTSPKGGFPPIQKCEKDEIKKIDVREKAPKNTVNIGEILQKRKDSEQFIPLE